MVCDFRSKKKGFDAKSIYNKALSLKGDLDKLFQEREVAVRSCPSEAQPLLKSQECVLKDMRNLSLLEFSKLYADSRKRRAGRDLTTLGTIAVCATGAFPGALSVVNGIKEVNLKKVGGGGIGFLISGSTLTAAPILIHGGAAIVNKISSHKLAKVLEEAHTSSIATLEKDLDQLKKLTNETPSIQTQLTVAQTGRYSLFSDLLKQRQESFKKDQQRQKREVLESFIAYAAKGGPQIAFGSMLTRAGYKYKTSPVPAFRGVAQAATVNEISWADWMLDTAQKGVREEFYNAKVGKQKAETEPFSVSNITLKELDKISVSQKE